MEAALPGPGQLRWHSRAGEGYRKGHTGEEGPVPSPTLLESQELKRASRTPASPPFKEDQMETQPHQKTDVRNQSCEAVAAHSRVPARERWQLWDREKSTTGSLSLVVRRKVHSQAQCGSPRKFRGLQDTAYPGLSSPSTGPSPGITGGPLHIVLARVESSRGGGSVLILAPPLSQTVAFPAAHSPSLAAPGETNSSSQGVGYMVPLIPCVPLRTCLGLGRFYYPQEERAGAAHQLLKDQRPALLKSLHFCLVGSAAGSREFFSASRITDADRAWSRAA